MEVFLHTKRYQGYSNKTTIIECEYHKTGKKIRGIKILFFQDSTQLNSIQIYFRNTDVAGNVVNVSGGYKIRVVLDIRNSYILLQSHGQLAGLILLHR